MARQRKYTSLAELRDLIPQSTPVGTASPSPEGNLRPWRDGKGKALRILLDTKGRKGKVVTLVIGLQHNPQTIADLAGALKRHCGAGGTVREGTIEIQGDQREKAAEYLRELNYRVPGAG